MLISEFAQRAGVSRATLLYYEKLGLIKGQRGQNGYRYFGQQDLQTLLLLKSLQTAGLMLSECKELLEQGIQKDILQSRLADLENEIQLKCASRDLLKALLGDNPEGLNAFHRQMESNAPQAHMQWLIASGLQEDEAQRLRWLSRNLHEHEDFMQDFATIFKPLTRHGPGTDADSLWALSQIEPTPSSVLDIGCGPGAATIILAAQGLKVIALDNFAQSLQLLKQRLLAAKLENQVTICNASMLDIPYPDESFDLLWAEGSAYIMGFEAALQQWKRLIRAGGHIVISDAVWTSTAPEKEMAEFWQREYPDMQLAQTRIAQCQEQGYRVVAHKLLDSNAWNAYVEPLTARLNELEYELKGSDALNQLRDEIKILREFEGNFSYLLMVLKKR